MKRFKYFCI